MSYTEFVSKFYVKPKDGLRVLNPATMQPIAAEGEKVAKDPYWKRRQLDGDITISEQAFKKLRSKEKNK